MSKTIGERLFEIRAACGRTGREPETLDDFAARVLKATKRSYNPVTLSLLERMKRRWQVIDVETFAAVDPKKRGPVWLAGWDQPATLSHPPTIHEAGPGDRLLEEHDSAPSGARLVAGQTGKPRRGRKDSTR